MLLWFLLGWAGHTVAGFLTEVDDTRPPFWPLSDWERSSPVLLLQPLHYGRQFLALEHGGMLAITLLLLVRRTRAKTQREPCGAKPKPSRPA